MPKIFLIKNRLHQQQLRLLEAQNGAANKNELDIGDSQPLPLVVQKKEGKRPEIQFRRASQSKRETNGDFNARLHNNTAAETVRTPLAFQQPFRTGKTNVDFSLPLTFNSYKFKSRQRYLSPRAFNCKL